VRQSALFHVILYEPEIPSNTGNVIRLCANSGAKLHLVKPLGFRLDDKSLQRSGLDYHDMAEVGVHENLDHCLRQLTASRIFAIETGSPQRYSDMILRAGDAFLFGPETRGLPPHVLSLIGPAHCLSIPMRPRSRSLNLANAVALTVFEAWRQMAFEGSAPGIAAP